MLNIVDQLVYEERDVFALTGKADRVYSVMVQICS